MNCKHDDPVRESVNIAGLPTLLIIALGCGYGQLGTNRVVKTLHA